MSKMALESIKIIKSKNLPPETLVEHNLPKEGFIEVRMESHSNPISPKFNVLTEEKMDKLRKKLEGKGLLF